MLGGYPGLIMPFLKKLDRYQNEEPEEITTTYLRTIHLRTVMEKDLSVKRSLELYRGRPLKDSRSGYSRAHKQKDAGGQENANNAKGGEKS